MEQIELIQHWNYFCSLAERLDDTKHYIDHGLQEHNGKREQRYIRMFLNRLLFYQRLNLK